MTDSNNSPITADVADFPSGAPSNRFAIIDAWVVKFCLSSGTIFHVRAWELGPTGKIKVVDGELRNLEFGPGEWDPMECVARSKAERMRDGRIAKIERELEALRGLSFNGALEAAE